MYVRLDPEHTFAHIINVWRRGTQPTPGTRWFEPSAGRPPEQSELTPRLLRQLLLALPSDGLGAAVLGLERSADRRTLVMRTEHLGEQHFTVQVEPASWSRTAVPPAEIELNTGEPEEPHVIRVRADLPGELVTGQVVQCSAGPSSGWRRGPRRPSRACAGASCTCRRSSSGSGSRRAGLARSSSR